MKLPTVYTLQFTEQEVDAIARAVQQAPWFIANPLLLKLQQQMQTQSREPELPLGQQSQHVQNGHDKAPAAGV